MKNNSQKKEAAQPQSAGPKLAYSATPQEKENINHLATGIFAGKEGAKHQQENLDNIVASNEIQYVLKDIVRTRNKSSINMLRLFYECYENEVNQETAFDTMHPLFSLLNELDYKTKEYNATVNNNLHL